MDPEPPPARPRRLAIPIVAGLGLLSLLLIPRLAAEPEVTGVAALALAESHGLVPAVAHPTLGTEIYQWDPAIETAPPFRVGSVIEAEVAARDKSYTRIKSDNKMLDGTYLSIKPGDLRYWVRK